MNLILRLAFKSIACEKKKSMLIGFLYFVSAAFFTAEAFVLCNYGISSALRLDNTFGVHDGIFLCGTEAAVDFIKNDSNVYEAGTINVYASAVRSDEYSDREITIGTADEMAVKLNRISLIEGDFPDSSNEIVLEQSFLNFTYPNAKTGDKIKMDLISPEFGEKTFILSGIMNNISNLQWNTENRKPPMINALVSENCFRNKCLYSFVSVKYTNDNTDIQVLSDELLKKDSVLFYLKNQRGSIAALSFMGQNESIIAVAVLLVFTVIILLSVSIIYRKGSSQAVGLLKTVGFSVKSILMFFTVKFSALILPSVLFGSLAGFAAAVFIEIQNGGFYAYENAPIILGMCVLSVIIASVLFTVKSINKECQNTVVENLRSQETEESNIPTITFTTEKPLLLYSVKSFIINGKETAAACIMIFISVLITYIGFFVFSYFGANIESELRPYDFRISFAEEYVTVMSTYRNNCLGITDTEYEALKSCNDVKDIVGIKKFMIYELTENEVDYTGEVFGSAEEFIECKASFGFPKDKYIMLNKLTGADNEALERLNKYVKAGKIDLEALSSGDEVIICGNNNTDFKYKVGDVIKLANILNEDSEAIDTSKMKLFETEVRVGGLVEYDDNAEDRLLKEQLQGLVWSESAFEKVFGFKFNYRDIRITVSDKDCYDNLSTLINDLNIRYSSESINSNDGIIIFFDLQQSKAYEQAYSSFISIALTVSVGCAVFSLVSLISAVITKITKRRRIFGFLRAAGLNKQQMLAMIFSENLLSFVISFVSGIFFGFGLCMILSRFVEPAAAPLLPLTVFFGIYALILGVVCCEAAAANFRISIIDCIRYNE